MFTKNAAGLPVQILGAAQDITERKLAELALQESESKFRSVFNSALNAIAITDDYGRYIDANSSACELFGVSKEELMGSSIADFAEPAFDFTQVWQSFGEQGQLSGEFRLYRPDGIVREVEYAARTNFLPHRHLSILRDISEQQAALRERKQAGKTLQESTAQYRRIIETTIEGVWLIDAQSKTNFLNRQMAEMLGYSVDEMLGMPLFAFVAEEERAIATDYTERCRQGIQERHDFKFRRQDGSDLWASLSTNTIFDDSGQYAGALAMVTDITERKQAEEHLTRISKAVESTSDGICIADIYRKSTYHNQAFVNLYGYTIAELNAAGGLPAMYAQSEIAEQVLESILNGRSWSGEVDLKTKSGGIVPTLLRADCIVDDSGDHIGLIGVCTDITERKRAEEALRQYERIVSATPDGVALVNRNYTYRLVNQTYLLRHNRCQDEIIGHPISELLGADVFTDTIKPALDQSLAGETTRYEAWFNYPTAGHRFISVTYAPYIEMDGTISGVVVNSRDLSELKQAEEKIREQAALLDIATDAIFVRNLDNQILFWNKGAEHLYGWSSQETLGKNAKALLNKEFTPQLEEALKTVAESGSWQGELHKVDKFGKEIIVASRLTLVREQGQPKSILTVDTDITEKKKLEAQFLRAQRMESIGTLAGGIAHDLNNVLAPILMSVQLLQMKFPEQQSARLLKTLENNVKRGAALIKQVLSFARGIEGDRTIVQVRHLILEIDQIVKETFPKSIELYTDIAPDLWTVSADATQLHQVLMNFCVNARDAMPNGGTLTISATNVLIDEGYARMNIEAKVGPHVVITVADTGTGIPPQVIERIFDPFFTTKEVGKGTGLGLSTALGIIKSHGGFVEVSSQVGQGTQFKVYLPTNEETATQPGEDPELLTGQGELVLVVDDEAAIREIILTTLESYNYRVLTANDGIEALALYAQHKNEISVVLIDMMMPEMDGVTAIRTLQIMNPSVKIIATSGLAFSDQVSLTVGTTRAQAFLPKPYTTPELLKTLHELLSAK